MFKRTNLLWRVIRRIFHLTRKLNYREKNIPWKIIYVSSILMQIHYPLLTRKMIVEGKFYKHFFPWISFNIFPRFSFIHLRPFQNQIIFLSPFFLQCCEWINMNGIDTGMNGISFFFIASSSLSLPSCLANFFFLFSFMDYLIFICLYKVRVATKNKKRVHWKI